MVPDKSKTCVGLEYFCFEGDGLWDSKDEDLIALATKETRQAGPGGPRRRSSTAASSAMPKAYPVYDEEYAGHLDKIREFMDPIPNLHLIGRNGMHKYNNQDHSMLTALMTVENMNGARHDTWAVNTDFEYHETQRVEEETPKSEPRPVAVS